MQKRQTPSARVSTQRRIDWLAVGVGFVFALVILVAVLLVYYYRSAPTAAPSSLPTPAQPSATSPIPVASATPTTIPEPTATATISVTPLVYIVRPGDTLSGIASAFGVSVDALKAANALTTDIIFADQVLVIPGGVVTVNPPVNNASDALRYQVTDSDTLAGIAAAQGVSEADLRTANGMIGDALFAGQFISIPQGAAAVVPWRFSSLSGELQQAYPLTAESERFVLHYQPQTFPAQDPEALVRLESESLAYLESLTGTQLPVKYDVYVAGTVFEAPNRALRGITYSSFQKTFFLHDGTGNAADQRYIVTHELTHLFFWNTLGSPASTMLSEGTAVYTGMEFIRDAGHMPIESFCALYLQAGVLPGISGSLSYTGHILDLENYYAAGCFVKYLVDTYGIEPLKAVYHSGNYTGVYGKGLPALEQEWRTHLRTLPALEGLDPTEYIRAVRMVESAYASFFARFGGSPRQLEAYRVLDQARIALLEGDLTALQIHLDVFNTLK